MTDPRPARPDAAEQQLIEKGVGVVAAAAPCKGTSFLRNGLKLALRKKNGYKTVVSKSNEDLSLEGAGENALNEATNGSPTSDLWFNTWPERYDKGSPERQNGSNNNSNNQNTQSATGGFNNKLTLQEALKNISLAYSPVTRKLHLVEDLGTLEKESHCSDIRTIVECDNSKADDEILLAKEDIICQPKKFGHRRIQDGSFSSTISTLSEPSTSGSLIGSEDRSLSNFGDDINACPEEKTRRKSLTQFFTKNVFSWKSNGSAESGGSSSSSSVWKLFGRTTANTNGSPLHTVASSSALIQLKRPSSLPAKTLEEEQKHQQEYNEILAAAKKKEAKSTAAKEKLKKLQLQQEEQQATAAKHFSQHVIPNWGQMEKNKKTQELWWQGLPSSIRGKVWRLAIGNELNITPQLYEICLVRAQNRLNSPEPPPCEYENDQESSMDVIELDISRTFPNLGIFQQGGPYSDVLHSLLAAYVCFRPDVGYVQGMSYIAAILILNMEPCDAFICFANVLNQPLHLSAFTLNQQQMNAYYAAYDQVLEANMPKLYAHFECAALTPDLYLLDWIYTVFAKAMPLDVACRIWDIFLRDGYEFIFRTALGILHMYQPVLLTMDFLHGAQFLTKLPEDMSADQLFKSIQNVSTTWGKLSFGQIVDKCGGQSSTTDMYR